MQDSKPIIAFAALGGTIAMTSTNDNAGLTATVKAQTLINSLPQLQEISTIRSETLYQQSSCSLSFAQLFSTLNWAKQQIQTGADAVIISQGTDTIEQTAFFFDLFWQYTQPLIVIGAMRSPEAVGFDGLANLLAAAYVGIHPKSLHRGVLVVLNDTVHQARFVQKTHTTALETFRSPIHGPCAIVQENTVCYLHPPLAPCPHFPLPTQHTQNVMIIEHGIDDCPSYILPALQTDIHGLVVSGVGSGHVSEHMRDVLVEAAKKVPVIVCSRTGSGSTTLAVYGYKGAEIDLQQNGILMGGWLPAIKARLLLLAALWNGLDKPSIEQMLHAWGYMD